MKQKGMLFSVQILDLPLIAGRVSDTKGNYIDVTALIKENESRIILSKDIGRRIYAGLESKDISKYQGRFRIGKIEGPGPEIMINADIEDFDNSDVYQLIIGKEAIEATGIRVSIIYNDKMEIIIPLPGIYSDN